MQSFYDGRTLAKKLNIPLARFKRWGREFLPPDNLGGFQSGYARQYNVNEAFRVYLGGFLVHDAKLAIAQAREVMECLKDRLPNLYGSLSESEYAELRLALVVNSKGRVLCKFQNGARVIWQDDDFEESIADLVRAVLVGKILQRFVTNLNA